MNTRVLNKLYTMNACNGAMDWLTKQKDLATAWTTCPYATWMLWLVKRISTDELYMHIYRAVEADVGHMYDEYPGDRYTTEHHMLASKLLRELLPTPTNEDILRTSLVAPSWVLNKDYVEVREAATLLSKLDACEESIGWLKTQPSIKDAWRNCADPLWLYWLSDRLLDEHSVNKFFDAFNRAEQDILTEDSYGTKREIRRLCGKIRARTPVPTIEDLTKAVEARNFYVVGAYDAAVEAAPWVY